MVNSGDEKRIVEKAKAGDDAAFALLVGRYADPTFAFVRRIAANREQAEDIVQDSFVKAWSNLRKFDGRSSFQTWLLRIACNTALSAARNSRSSSRKMVNADERLWQNIADSEVDTFFADEADESLIPALNQALDTLAPDEKVLITSFYFDDRPIAECAAILGMSDGNAKVQLHRIRKKLYAMIKNRKDER